MIITKTICDICGKEMQPVGAEIFELEIRESKYKIKDICFDCHYGIMDSINNLILNRSERAKALNDYILPEEGQNDSEEDSEGINDLYKVNHQVADFIKALDNLYADTGLSVRNIVRGTSVGRDMEKEVVIMDCGIEKARIEFEPRKARYDVISVRPSASKGRKGAID